MQLTTYPFFFIHFLRIFFLFLIFYPNDFLGVSILYLKTLIYFKVKIGTEIQYFFLRYMHGIWEYLKNKEKLFAFFFDKINQERVISSH